MNLEIIGEKLVLTEWWIAFLLTYFHISISTFIFSFRIAKTIEQRIK